MSREAQYVITEDDFLREQPLIIKDIGHSGDHFTITNDAEGVVKRLVAKGHLPEGRRLLYIDSDGALDEILIKDGSFAGFKPGPRRAG